MTQKLSDKLKKNVQFNYKIEMSVEIKVNGNYEIRWGIINSMSNMDREMVLRAFIDTMANEYGETMEAAINNERQFFGKDITDEEFEKIKEAIAEDALFIDTLQSIQKISNEKFTSMLRFIFDKTNADRINPKIIIPKGTIFK